MVVNLIKNHMLKHMELVDKLMKVVIIHHQELNLNLVMQILTKLK